MPSGYAHQSTNAILTQATADMTYFTCAILTGATITGVDLSTANLHGVVSGGVDGTVYPFRSSGN